MTKGKAKTNRKGKKFKDKEIGKESEGGGGRESER